jgi:ferredoxin-NAD(P)+ reductase (naphthalene dioxygenase ferredoxin-specific)
MELVVQPHGHILSVRPGANLLEALRAHNVPVSYSCMAGRCGTCRCKVLEGQVLETGREAGMAGLHEDLHVLACMSVLTESCTIEIPEPDEVVIHPARVLKATLVAIEHMTHDIRRLRLWASRPLSFSPGQYVNLQFTPAHGRPYSMAGLCTDEELEFHVRLVPDGPVSGYIAGELRVGAAVRVTGPLGTAYLRTRHAGPMLCVAGDTGLAPILSIVRGALAGGMDNPIHLYYGVRTPHELYGAQWLDELARRHRNLHVHIVVTSGNDNPRHRSGLVTEALAQDWHSLDGWRAYLCGSPPTVEAATFLVRQKGVPPEHIHANAFYANSS